MLQLFAQLRQLYTVRSFLPPADLQMLKMHKMPAVRLLMGAYCTSPRWPSLATCEFQSWFRDFYSYFFKALNGLTHANIQNLLTLHQPMHCLRWSAGALLTHKLSLKGTGPLPFGATACLMMANSMSSFKYLLKTHFNFGCVGNCCNACWLCGFYFFSCSYYLRCL